jgi:hydrogenase maturation protease
MSKKTLLIGYGNPGRMDDGIANECIERTNAWIEENKLQNIDTVSVFQINIEDSMRMADYDTVIFIDASIENIDNFIITKIEPNLSPSQYTTHASSPAYSLALCHEMFKKYPETYLFHIKGYEFEFKEGLTENGASNLNEAFEVLKEILSDPSTINTYLK